MSFIHLLLSLPQELLLCISDFLGQADSTCLALCSKELAARLPKATSWARNVSRSRSSCLCRNHEMSNRIGDSFLCRIALSSPTYLCCYRCHVLHDITTWLTPQIQDYIRNRQCWKSRKLLQCGQEDSLYDLTYGQCLNVPSVSLSSYLLAFQMVQLAMIRFRFGRPYSIPLHWLSTLEVRTTYLTSRVAPISLILHTAEPLIVAASCHLRVQQWILFADGQPLLDYVDIYKDSSVRSWLCTCPYRGREPAFDSDHEHLFKCNLRHRHDQVSCQACSRFIECTSCNAVLQLKSHSLRDGRLAWVVTKWLDLGEGINPHDGKWRQQVAWRTNRTAPRFVEESERSRRNRQAFESTSDRSIERLTTDNAILLQDNYYEKAMTEHTPNVWYAPLKGAGPETTWPVDWRDRTSRK